MDTENTTTATLTDADQARSRLVFVREDLRSAVDRRTAATDKLWTLIVQIRPSGKLSVDKIAEAVRRNRHFVDSVWSARGETTKGKQTRVPVTGTEAEAAEAFDTLRNAADELAAAQAEADNLTKTRNAVVAEVYASKALGPNEISRVVGIDRNHVGRICRTAGIPPLHRADVRNQYTQGK